nr:hypothetical protein HannXRQ_Chr08g0236081 [Tanacetum cinerariifolium]
QSDLAGERSQFTTKNKTEIERTFVRFFSTKHRSLRITVVRWLPKETPIRSAPPAGRHLPHPDHKERFTMMGVLLFFPSEKNEMHRGPSFCTKSPLTTVGNKMHKAFPLPGESFYWQYKFPRPVEGVPTARRMEIPLPGVCTAMMKKLPVKDRWQLH